MGTSGFVSVGKCWDNSGSVVVLQCETRCTLVHIPLQHFDFTLASPLCISTVMPESRLPHHYPSHKRTHCWHLLLFASCSHEHVHTETHTETEYFFSRPVNRTDGAALLSCVLRLSCPLYCVQRNQSWFVGLWGCSQRRQTWTKALRTTTAVTQWFITFAPNKEQKFTEKVLFTGMQCTRKIKSNETHAHTRTHSHTSVLSQCFLSMCCEVSHQHREA